MGVLDGLKRTLGLAPKCTHGDAIREVAPATPEGCAECLATGGRWVHLRVCLTCGHVGCCDASPGKHATAHFRAEGHPIVQSYEPGEAWRWCYADERSLPDGRPFREAP